MVFRKQKEGTTPVGGKSVTRGKLNSTLPLGPPAGVASIAS
jgi:hypothetical protein